MNLKHWGSVAALACLVLGGCRAIQVTESEKDLTEYRSSGNEAFYHQDYQLAGEQYSKYLERHPNVAEVRHRMGVCDLELGRVASARTNFAIAHDLEPANESFTIGLARAILAGGDQDEFYNFMRDLKDSAVFAQTYLTVGKVAFLGGLHDEAEGAFMSASTLIGQTSAEPHRHLARFYSDIGDSESAAIRWRMVLSFDIADDEANSSLRNLGVIPGPSMALEPDSGVPGN